MVKENKEQTTDSVVKKEIEEVTETVADDEKSVHEETGVNEENVVTKDDQEEKNEKQEENEEMNSVEKITEDQKEGEEPDMIVDVNITEDQNDDDVLKDDNKGENVGIFEEETTVMKNESSEEDLKDMDEASFEELEVPMETENFTIGDDAKTNSAPPENCRICGKGNEDGRPMVRFLPSERYPEDISLHIFCGKTAFILSGQPEFEILTMKGLKYKHGIGTVINSAISQTRSANPVGSSTSELPNAKSTTTDAEPSTSDVKPSTTNAEPSTTDTSNSSGTQTNSALDPYYLVKEFEDNLKRLQPHHLKPTKNLRNHHAFVTLPPKKNSNTKKTKKTSTKKTSKKSPSKKEQPKKKLKKKVKKTKPKTSRHPASAPLLSSSSMKSQWTYVHKPAKVVSREVAAKAEQRLPSSRKVHG